MGCTEDRDLCLSSTLCQGWGGGPEEETGARWKEFCLSGRGLCAKSRLPKMWGLVGFKTVFKVAICGRNRRLPAH